MRKYFLYRIRTGNRHLSESIAESITMYCLGLMKKSTEVYTDWRIGLTNNRNLNIETHYRQWECQNNIETRHTKAYFLDKGMVNNTPNENGDEIFIYIYRP